MTTQPRKWPMIGEPTPAALGLDEPAPPTASPPATAPTSGLAGAVALVTARQSGIAATPGELVPDTDPTAIVRALITIAAALLDNVFNDRGANLLERLGLEAAQNHPTDSPT
jgi:hypothetical protein